MEKNNTKLKKIILSWEKKKKKQVKKLILSQKNIYLVNKLRIITLS